MVPTRITFIICATSLALTSIITNRMDIGLVAVGALAALVQLKE